MLISSLSLGTDVVKLRDFIRAKYIEKKWFSEDGVPSAAAAAPAAVEATRRSSIAVAAPASSTRPGSISAVRIM